MINYNSFENLYNVSLVLFKKYKRLQYLIILNVFFFSIIFIKFKGTSIKLKVLKSTKALLKKKLRGLKFVNNLIIKFNFTIVLYKLRKLVNNIIKSFTIINILRILLFKTTCLIILILIISK